MTEHEQTVAGALRAVVRGLAPEEKARLRAGLCSVEATLRGVIDEPPPPPVEDPAAATAAPALHPGGAR